MADVYVAVKTECMEVQENVNCGEAAKQLDNLLEKILVNAEQQTIKYLRQFTIADVMTHIDFSANS